MTVLWCHWNGPAVDEIDFWWRLIWFVCCKSPPGQTGFESEKTWLVTLYAQVWNTFNVNKLSIHTININQLFFVLKPKSVKKNKTASVRQLRGQHSWLTQIGSQYKYICKLEILLSNKLPFLNGCYLEYTLPGMILKVTEFLQKL